MLEPVGGELGAGLPGEGQVAPHVEVREQREALGDVPDAASLDRNVVDELVAVPDGSRARPVETREAPQQRGLTRARRAEHREMIDARLVSDAKVERAESMVEVKAHRLGGRWARASSVATRSPDATTGVERSPGSPARPPPRRRARGPSAPRWWAARAR